MTIDKMVEELLSEQIEEKDGIIFTKKSIELIHDITKECEKIAIVKKTQEQAEEFAKELTAEDVYIHMLTRIIDAPTQIHRRCVPRMLIPVIDKKLKERGL